MCPQQHSPILLYELWLRMSRRFALLMSRWWQMRWKWGLMRKYPRLPNWILLMSRLYMFAGAWIVSLVRSLTYLRNGVRWPISKMLRRCNMLNQHLVVPNTGDMLTRLCTLPRQYMRYKSIILCLSPEYLAPQTRQLWPRCNQMPKWLMLSIMQRANSDKLHSVGALLVRKYFHVCFKLWVLPEWHILSLGTQLYV